MPKKKSRLSWRSRRKQRGGHGDIGQWEQDLAGIFSTCGTPVLKPNESIRTRQEGLRKLLLIVNATSSVDLAQLEMKHILYSALGIFCLFKLNLLKSHKTMGLWMRRRCYERSRRLYADLMEKIFQADLDEDIFHFILDFLSEFKLWRHEHLAIDTLNMPMKSGGMGSSMLANMLDHIEGLGDRNEQDARHMVRVLYEVLNNYFWPSLDVAAAKAITRLLKMYRTAVRVEYEQELVSPVAAGSYTRKGLEVSLRRVIEHMQNSDLMLIVGYMVEWVSDRKLGDETILDFGTVLEHAALVHQSEMYKLTFTHTLFDNLFDIVGSERRVVSHLGNRILHHLLDRHENRLQFEAPKIFFQNTHFNINVCSVIPEDKVFLKKHRPKIHECIMRAIIKHAMHRVNLESIYTTICLLATEVPCGYTAAALANLVMNIQEAARNHAGYRAQVQYHLHALVVGVLSLLCWLHNAPDFYKYLNKVVNMRAEQAPHLNPPLRLSYMFAQHHILWDKPELFFDDWEVRYSLWMRFKIKDTEIFLLSRNAAAPPNPAVLDEALFYDPSLAAHVPKLTRRQELEPYLPKRTPLTLADLEWLEEQERRDKMSREAGKSIYTISSTSSGFLSGHNGSSGSRHSDDSKGSKKGPKSSKKPRNTKDSKTSGSKGDGPKDSKGDRNKDSKTDKKKDTKDKKRKGSKGSGSNTSDAEESNASHDTQKHGSFYDHEESESDSSEESLQYNENAQLPGRRKSRNWYGRKKSALSADSGVSEPSSSRDKQGKPKKSSSMAFPKQSYSFQESKSILKTNEQKDSEEQPNDSALQSGKGSLGQRTSKAFRHKSESIPSLSSVDSKVSLSEQPKKYLPQAEKGKKSVDKNLPDSSKKTSMSTTGDPQSSSKSTDEATPDTSPNLRNSEQSKESDEKKNSVTLNKQNRAPTSVDSKNTGTPFAKTGTESSEKGSELPHSGKRETSSTSSIRNKEFGEKTVTDYSPGTVDSKHTKLSVEKKPPSPSTEQKPQSTTTSSTAKNISHDQRISLSLAGRETNIGSKEVSKDAAETRPPEDVKHSKQSTPIPEISNKMKDPQMNKTASITSTSSVKLSAPVVDKETTNTEDSQSTSTQPKVSNEQKNKRTTDQNQFLSSSKIAEIKDFPAPLEKNGSVFSSAQKSSTIKRPYTSHDRRETTDGKPNISLTTPDGKKSNATRTIERESSITSSKITTPPPRQKSLTPPLKMADRTETSSSNVEYAENKKITGEIHSLPQPKRKSLVSPSSGKEYVADQKKRSSMVDFTQDKIKAKSVTDTLPAKDKLPSDNKKTAADLKVIQPHTQKSPLPHSYTKEVVVDEKKRPEAVDYSQDKVTTDAPRTSGERKSSISNEKKSSIKSTPLKTSTLNSKPTTETSPPKVKDYAKDDKNTLEMNDIPPFARKASVVDEKRRSSTVYSPQGRATTSTPVTSSNERKPSVAKEKKSSITSEPLKTFTPSTELESVTDTNPSQIKNYAEKMKNGKEMKGISESPRKSLLPPSYAKTGVVEEKKRSSTADLSQVRGTTNAPGSSSSERKPSNADKKKTSITSVSSKTSIPSFERLYDTGTSDVKYPEEAEEKTPSEVKTIPPSTQKLSITLPHTTADITDKSKISSLIVTSQDKVATEDSGTNKPKSVTETSTSDAIDTAEDKKTSGEIKAIGQSNRKLLNSHSFTKAATADETKVSSVIDSLQSTITADALGKYEPNSASDKSYSKVKYPVQDKSTPGTMEDIDHHTQKSLVPPSYTKPGEVDKNKRYSPGQTPQGNITGDFSEISEPKSVTETSPTTNKQTVDKKPTAEIKWLPAPTQKPPVPQSDASAGVVDEKKRSQLVDSPYNNITGDVSDTSQFKTVPVTSSSQSKHIVVDKKTSSVLNGTTPPTQKSQQPLLHMKAGVTDEEKRALRVDSLQGKSAGDVAHTSEPKSIPNSSLTVVHTTDDKKTPADVKAIHPPSQKPQVAPSHTTPGVGDEKERSLLGDSQEGKITTDDSRRSEHKPVPDIPPSKVEHPVYDKKTPADMKEIPPPTQESQVAPSHTKPGVIDEKRRLSVVDSPRGNITGDVSSRSEPNPNPDTSPSKVKTSVDDKESSEIKAIPPATQKSQVTPSLWKPGVVDEKKRSSVVDSPQGKITGDVSSISLPKSVTETSALVSKNQNNTSSLVDFSQSNHSGYHKDNVDATTVKTASTLNSQNGRSGVAKQPPNKISAKEMSGQSNKNINVTQKSSTVVSNQSSNSTNIGSKPSQNPVQKDTRTKTTVSVKASPMQRKASTPNRKTISAPSDRTTSSVSVLGKLPQLQTGRSLSATYSEPKQAIKTYSKMISNEAAFIKDVKNKFSTPPQDSSKNTSRSPSHSPRKTPNTRVRKVTMAPDMRQTHITVTTPSNSHPPSPPSSRRASQLSQISRGRLGSPTKMASYPRKSSSSNDVNKVANRNIDSPIRRSSFLSVGSAVSMSSVRSLSSSPAARQDSRSPLNKEQHFNVTRRQTELLPSKNENSFKELVKKSNEKPPPPSGVRHSHPNSRSPAKTASQNQTGKQQPNKTGMGPNTR